MVKWVEKVKRVKIRLKCVFTAKILLNRLVQKPDYFWKKNYNHCRLLVIFKKINPPCFNLYISITCLTCYPTCPTHPLVIYVVFVSNVTRVHADEKFSAPYLSEQNPVSSSQDSTDGKESLQSSTEPESDTEADLSSLSEATELWKNFVDSLVLVCCEDSVFVYSTKFLIQVHACFSFIFVIIIYAFSFY